jgi:ribosomal protein S18 acetylase RimI-like enzyme
MPDFAIRIFEPHDEPLVVRLWQDCNLTIPANDPHRDIALKLARQPELFFVATIQDRVVGTVMVGYDGHRGWINYLAVAPNERRKGIGRELMRHAEASLRKLHCPKMNLQVRAGNQSVVAFYKAIGFDVEERVSMGKRLT